MPAKRKTGATISNTVNARFTNGIQWNLINYLDNCLLHRVLTRDTRRNMMLNKSAKYHLGQVVRHKKHPFRGVIFDVDPEFSNTDEWYEAIPEDSRPKKAQPYYHLLAENDQSYYVAYVSEQNLIADRSGEPVDHPDIPDLFGPFEDGAYPLHFQLN